MSAGVLVKSRSTCVTLTRPGIDPPSALSHEPLVSRDLCPVAAATALSTLWVAMRTSRFGGVASGTIDFAWGGKRRHGDRCKHKQYGSKQMFFHLRTVAAGLKPMPATQAIKMRNSPKKHPDFLAHNNDQNLLTTLGVSAAVLPDVGQTALDAAFFAITKLQSFKLLYGVALLMSAQKKIATALLALNALDLDDVRGIADAIAGRDFAAVSEDALNNFTRAIVEICASIGDNYRDGKDDADGTAGDAIRAKFGVA
jgi:hypothetical protein